ncbi:MAG: hypothetical protein AAGI25_16550 [Bacteroidota bacterium]
MKNLLLIFLLIIVLFNCTNMSPIKQKHFNVAYANDSDKQKMDIFIPEAEGLPPSVVLIHG